MEMWITIHTELALHTAAEDLEAGTRKTKFQAEPTLPIYLKVNKKSFQVSL